MNKFGNDQEEYIVKLLENEARGCKASEDNDYGR